MPIELTDAQMEKLGEGFGRGFAHGMAEERRRVLPVKEESLRIKSIDELSSIWKGEADVKWLVPDFLPEASVNLLSSRSGTGKTWLAYFLAGCVAHGSPVFGKAAGQRKVVYIDGENPLYVVKERLFNLGIAETPNLKVWGGWEVERPPGPDHPLIVEYAKREHPLLIWDSLVEFHTGDEQSSTATRAFMKHFRHLANLGATVLVLCHTGKASSAKEYRGSSDIEAAVDMAFLLESTVNDRKLLDYLRLVPFKCRISPLERRCLKYIQGSGFELSELQAEVQRPGKPDAHAIVEQVVRDHPGINQSEIVSRAKEYGIGKGTVCGTLKSAAFRCEKGQGNTHLYYPHDPEAPEQPPVREEVAA